MGGTRSGKNLVGLTRIVDVGCGVELRDVSEDLYEPYFKFEFCTEGSLTDWAGGSEGRGRSRGCRRRGEGFPRSFGVSCPETGTSRVSGLVGEAWSDRSTRG